MARRTSYEGLENVWNLVDVRLLLEECSSLCAKGHVGYGVTAI